MSRCPDDFVSAAVAESFGNMELVSRRGYRKEVTVCQAPIINLITFRVLNRQSVLKRSGHWLSFSFSWDGLCKSIAFGGPPMFR
jgi:hypothetical protein